MPVRYFNRLPIFIRNKPTLNKHDVYQTPSNQEDMQIGLVPCFIV
uniref:Uncharacterized protein n=1 Tax=Ciona intestinalis TaxID=7719 RepID=H2XTL9_CIOIN